MRKIFLLLPLLAIILFSCIKEQRGKICTEEFRSLTVTIKDQAAKPVVLDSGYTLIVSTNSKISPMPPFAELTPGTYVIFSDSHQTLIPENKNSQIRFVGVKGANKVVDEPYIVTQDGCHVSLGSGKTDITITQ